MTGAYTRSLSVPGQTLETFVGADVNTIVITNLLSGMDYNVKIFASQATGFSDALTGLVKTREPGLMSARFSPASGSVLGFTCVSSLSSIFSATTGFSFLLVTLSGWHFVERRVWQFLRAVQSPSWQADASNCFFQSA